MSKLASMPNQPLVSIDAVPLVVHNGQLHLVLGVRDYEPFAGEAALPGVLLNAHERIHEAVERALLSKIGVQSTDALVRIEGGVFDDFERDLRGPTLSLANIVVLRREAPLNDSRVRIVPLINTLTLPFDHANIVRHAARVVLNSLWSDEALTKALLGDTFDTAEVIAKIKELSEAAGLPSPETGNVGRSLRSNKRLVQVSHLTPSVGRGRPPAAWTWV